MKSTGKSAPVKNSSGNVFADLGLLSPKERLAKAQLAHQIGQVITARGLTQAEAATIMGLDQPKISALLHGKLRGFSTDRLFQCLNALGQEIEITIRPVQSPGRRGNIHVITMSG